MKRSEMILKISQNLQKYENIFKGYKKESINLKCTCDNLATYLLQAIEKEGMLPPTYRFEDGDLGSNFLNEWEPENE